MDQNLLLHDLKGRNSLLNPLNTCCRKKVANNVAVLCPHQLLTLTADFHPSGTCTWFYSFLGLHLAAQVFDPFLLAQSIVNA